MLNAFWELFPWLLALFCTVGAALSLREAVRHSREACDLVVDSDRSGMGVCCEVEVLRPAVESARTESAHFIDQMIWIEQVRLGREG